jgi:hypothetical protein
MPLLSRSNHTVRAMKADIHPDYHDVVFHDVTSDFKFLTRSTMGSKETIKWEDGNDYPLLKVENLLGFASVLHGQAQGHRHQRPHRQVPEALRALILWR